MSNDTMGGLEASVETSPKSSLALRRGLFGFGSILALFCLAQAVPADGAVCIPAPTGVISWWPGDGDASDLRGGHSGTLLGGATATAAGEVLAAFGFDGTNGYVQIPDAPDLRPTNFTIEAWVRFSSLDSAASGGSPAGQQYIIFKQNTRTSNFEGFNFYKKRASNKDYFVFGVSSALGVVAEVQSSVQVSINTWYHLAGVRGSNFVQLYVNGQLQGQATANFVQDYGNFPLYFGSTGQSYWDHKLKGWLDEVTLYDRALASNDIAAIYTASSAGKCKSVTLLSQPQDQAVPAGTDAEFAVTATGFPPLTYQWQLWGTNLPTATNSSLLLTNVELANSGDYTVVARDSSPSSVTSEVAVLTVLLPPALTAQPGSCTNVSGTLAILSATASGSTPLTYRWFHDGVLVTNSERISGAAGSTLQISNVAAADAGSYQLVVTNLVGAATSEVAVLTILFPPRFTLQPISGTNTAGTTASLGAIATGTSPLRYQWQHDGVSLIDSDRIIGAATATLQISNLVPADAGSYWLVASNLFGTATSDVAVLTVMLPPLITSQPLSSTNILGGTVNFSATVAGSLPLGYQWRHDGLSVTNNLRISGAASATLQISNLVSADAGSYALVATNSVGAVTSSVAVLTLIAPPVILSPPASQEIVLGGTAHFSVTASGTLPLSYQWQHGEVDLIDGPDLSGARTSTLALANATTNDAGGYRIVVTNSAGATTSAVAVLVVHVTPLITVQPVSQTVASGSNVVFTVTASSPTPVGYQWRGNGLNLTDGGQFGGANGAAFTIGYALPVNNGEYSVVVSNLAGAATSAVATLTVNPPTDCLPPPSGLVGWWSGDGNARDLIGTNHGVLMGTATASAAGFNGQAFSFDGTNGYVQIPDSPDLRPTNLSVEVWVNFDAYQTPGNTYYSNQQYIVFKQNSQRYEFEGYALTKDHDPQGDVFLWEVASPTAELIRIDSVNTVVTGQWYHVVGVRGDDFVQLYMNGRFEVETNVDFPQDYGTNALYFGTSGQSYYDRRLHGRVDEVSLYNRALSADEIQALYQSGVAGKCKGTNGLMITQQPQGQAVLAGSNALFSVGATGLAPITYQWQVNGTPIAGETNSTLFLPQVQPGQEGVYRVVLIGPGGSRTSAGAALVLVETPFLQEPRLTPEGLFSFTLAGCAGQAYVVQCATNLVDWVDIGSISNATGLIEFVDPSSATNRARFYRVRWKQ